MLEIKIGKRKRKGSREIDDRIKEKLMNEKLIK